MFKKWFGSDKEDNRFSVFVVSDDAAVCRLIQDTLSIEGCTVQSATNVIDAIAMLDEMEDLPEVLIGDFHHPDIEGKEFLSKARVRFGKSTLPPVLFLMDSQEDETAGHDLGIDDLLTKPFDGPMLLSCVSKLIEHRRQSDSTL